MSKMIDTPLGKKNMDFIVKCLSSHDALVEALEYCLTSDGAVGLRDAGPLAQKRFNSINETARAALAKAKES